MEKWLDEAEGTLRANPVSPPCNIEQLEDTIIREHKVCWKAVSYTHLTLPTIYSV